MFVFQPYADDKKDLAHHNAMFLNPVTERIRHNSMGSIFFVTPTLYGFFPVAFTSDKSLATFGYCLKQ